MSKNQKRVDKTKVNLTPLQRQALVQAIHAQLPQTQCTRCGYLDCEAYAQAIVSEQAQINRCQPGGAQGVARLAKVMQKTVIPLDLEVGAEAPRLLAIVDEDWCIGCTKCIEACPVDAIVGAPKHMHVVLEAHCTGCELCLPVCPVDCIELIASNDESPAPMGWAAWSAEQAKNARERYALHQSRLTRGKEEKQKRLLVEGKRKFDQTEDFSKIANPHTLEYKRALIAKVLAKAQQTK